MRTSVFMFNDDYAFMEECRFLILGEFLSCLKMSLLQLSASIKYRFFQTYFSCCRLLFGNWN